MTTNTYTNLKLEQMAEGIQPLLDHADTIGYTAARNMRLITDAIIEYVKVKEQLLLEYGHEAENGGYRIDQGDEGFGEFWEKFSEVANDTHEIEFHKLPAERCVGSLTGKQFMDAWFMIDEEETND